MKLPDDHQLVEIESFAIPEGMRRGGGVGLRPVKGERFSTSFILEGNKSLAKDYPLGTRFKVQAALLKRPNGTEYLFTSWQWDVRIVGRPD